MRPSENRKKSYFRFKVAKKEKNLYIKNLLQGHLKKQTPMAMVKSNGHQTGVTKLFSR